MFFAWLETSLQKALERIHWSTVLTSFYIDQRLVAMVYLCHVFLHLVVTNHAMLTMKSFLPHDHNAAMRDQIVDKEDKFAYYYHP